MKTHRKFGEPSYSKIKLYLNSDKRYKQKHFVNKIPASYNKDTKKEIVIEAASRKCSMKDIAEKYDITRETIYLRKKELAGGTIMKNKNNDKSKDELIDEIEKLKVEHKKNEYKI